MHTVDACYQNIQCRIPEGCDLNTRFVLLVNTEHILVTNQKCTCGLLFSFYNAQCILALGFGSIFVYLKMSGELGG